MNEKTNFILAGNGPYDNRGCEAIVRGTVKILKHYYKDPSFLCVSYFQTQEQFEKQCRNESDPVITHNKTHNEIYKKSDLRYVTHFLQRNIAPKSHINKVYKEIFPAIKEVDAVLSVGGDNYSLDYGIPKLFTGLDDLVLGNKKPIIIWGASLGPFNRFIGYERYMKKHLQNITGIFARESATVKYLEEIGVTNNVYRVADPAFLMDASKPQFKKQIELEEDSIGINLSPLMARYTSNGNIEQWINKASAILKEITKKTENRIYLIPHVTNPNSNDYLFLDKVRKKIKDSEDRISLIPPIYNSAETKWIISKMKIFAGARTHSTIAALSSNVPTLSFAYSNKAKGINKDIFGHEDYCISPEELSSEIVAKKIELILEYQDEIRSDLKVVIPKIETKALLAGKILQRITG